MNKCDSILLNIRIDQQLFITLVCVKLNIFSAIESEETKYCGNGYHIFLVVVFLVEVKQINEFRSVVIR